MAKNEFEASRRGALRAIARELRVSWTSGLAHAIVRRRGFPRAFRSRALRLLGADIASSALINGHVSIAGRAKLVIGPRTFVNEGTYFDLAAATEIGSDCAIGYEVMFITATHRPGTTTRRAGPVDVRPISVGDGTWVGARATILPGVKIGEGCIIAAGAVVTGDCEPHTLYAGVPARAVRALEHDPVDTEVEP
jgi:maltose O-acetyltransferase